MAIRTPVFMSRFSCLEKVALNMSAIVWSTTSTSGVPYFRRSACIWSSPVALLLLKLLKHFLTSSGVLGFFLVVLVLPQMVLSLQLFCLQIYFLNVRRLCPVCHLDLTRVWQHVKLSDVSLGTRP